MNRLLRFAAAIDDINGRKKGNQSLGAENGLGRSGLHEKVEKTVSR